MQTVLIAEDDLYIRKVYERLLDKESYQVVVASDGEEALTTIREQKPALVLLDFMMPKMDGMSVLQAMQKDPALQSIPVIILTNIANDDVITSLKAAGAKSILIKSNVDTELVIQEIRKFLPVAEVL